MKEIKAEYLLFWSLILVLVILLVWRIVGSSPPIEAIGLMLTAVGAYFGWYSIKGSNKVSRKLEKLDDIENEGKKQTQILSEIKEILAKK